VVRESTGAIVKTKKKENMTEAQTTTPPVIEKLTFNQLAQLMDSIPGEGWPRRATQDFLDLRNAYRREFQHLGVELFREPFTVDGWLVHFHDLNEEKCPCGRSSSLSSPTAALRATDSSARARISNRVRQFSDSLWSGCRSSCAE